MMTKINGHFTCDNCYAAYLGTQQGVGQLLLQACNKDAAQILKGESISFEADASGYLYVVAWSDDSSYQGFMASLSGSNTIHTGSTAWKVLPSGKNKGNGEFPSIAEINAMIAQSGVQDWKDPFVGSENIKTGKPYGAVVNNIPQEAHWIWYDSGKDKGAKYPKSPYVPFKGFNHDEFLIFRIAATDLAPELKNQEKGCCCQPCCPPQPIVVSCCCKEEQPKPIPVPPKEECCCGTCVFEVRFQRWRYVSGKPGFLDGQAEIKFTSHINGNMYNYPATNGSWVALNKRQGSYPKGWRAANARVGVIEVPCSGRLGIDIMTELMEVAKKEKGFSFEGGEPYGTSEVNTVYLDCGNKPDYIRHKVKLEHGGNRTENLEIEVEYRFSEITACSCCGC